MGTNLSRSENIPFSINTHGMKNDCGNTEAVFFYRNDKDLRVVIYSK